jgi:hypothetical protein
MEVGIVASGGPREHTQKHACLFDDASLRPSICGSGCLTYVWLPVLNCNNPHLREMIDRFRCASKNIGP